MCAELRASYRIGSDTRGVIIRGTGDNAWPHRLHETVTNL
jgi:hypothetical protein